ncbi:hypothetical protein N7540_004453 [Penicillium herquei]|nr:hypothetical protein N7540_004453 [Penicillium herquei]
MTTPVFLRGFVPYFEYLTMMRHPLPPYDTDPFSATNNMRAHLRNCHGFTVQRTSAGNPYFTYQEVSREWYQSLPRPSDTQNPPSPDLPTSSPSPESASPESASPESEHQSAGSDQNRPEDSPGPENLNPPRGPDAQNPIFTVAIQPQDPDSQANTDSRVLIGTFQIWIQRQS